MLTWTRNLATAPKAVPEGMALLVILPGNDFPEAVHWVEYDDDLKVEVGEDGYSLFSSAAAVYGPGPPLIGGRLFNTGDDDPNASGPRFRSDAGQAVDLRAAKGHGSTRVKLQRDAKFPLRYRNLVGDYFKIIAESLEEER